jgi:hypothetical protein
LEALPPEWLQLFDHRIHVFFKVQGTHHCGLANIIEKKSSGDSDSGETVILLDGFPRDFAQIDVFEAKVGGCVRAGLID